MRGVLIASLLMIFSQVSSAKMSWEEMQNPNSYDNFSYQLLEWTHVFDAQPNYVALSAEALKSLEFWRVHLAAEAAFTKDEPKPARGLASMDGAPTQQLDGGAYSAWQGQGAASHMPIGDQNTRPAVCQSNENCLSDNQFHREPIELRINPTVHLPEARDVSVTPMVIIKQDPAMSPSEYSEDLERLRQLSRESSQSSGGLESFEGTTLGIALDVSGEPAAQDSTPEHLYLSEGDYRQRGEFIYQCIPGGGCNEVIGHTSDFQIIDDLDSISRNAVGRRQNTSSQSGQNTTTPTSTANRNHSSFHRASAMAQAFQRCEANYQRALDLCGSSSQSYNAQAVQNELNLRSGMQLAQYLQMARAASQSQGKSMYEICDNTQKMARSMTALNAAYTAICASAQNSCASSCAQADSYMRDTSTSDEEFSAALNSASSGFDPARFYNSCKSDMNNQITQGIFETAQTAQMMAQANSCKQQIAAAGPCATPEMWDSQACYDWCQEPKNSYAPACARFTAMNSNCSNPEFARQNPMCLCINNPDDPSCGASGLLPDDDVAGGGPGGGGIVGAPGRGGIPTSTGSGSFGSRQAFQGGAQRSGQASSASQGSFPAGGAGGPIMPSSSGGGGSAAPAPGGQGGARGAAYNTHIIDGVQNFGGGRSGARGQQRRYVAYGDMNSSNPYRRVAVETDDPDFDLKQYLPPEDFEAGSVRKCYYGKDRIGCMHGPSLFDMVSRQYRKLRHQMMP